MSVEMKPLEAKHTSCQIITINVSCSGQGHLLSHTLKSFDVLYCKLSVKETLIKGKQIALI